MGNNCSANELPIALDSLACDDVLTVPEASNDSNCLLTVDLVETVDIQPENNFDFVVFVCLLGPVTIVGIAGNLCAFFALRSIQVRQVAAITMLRTLSMANILLLLVAFFHRTLETVVRRNDLLGCHIQHYQADFTTSILHAAADMTHTIAVYCILMVTIDRYLLVYRPARSRDFCKPCTVRIWIAAIFVFPVLLYLPRVFDFETNASDQLDDATLLSDAVSTHTPFAIAPSYHVVSKGFLAYRLLDLSVQSLIPVTLIAVMNGHLINAIRGVQHAQRSRDYSCLDGVLPSSSQPAAEAYRMQQLQPAVATVDSTRSSKAFCYSFRSLCSVNLAPPTQPQGGQVRSRSSTGQQVKRQSEERSILLTLVLIVSIFVFFELPMLTLSLIRFAEILFAFRLFGEQHSMTLYKFSAIAQLFENVQACSSFFLYCSSYASFRRTVKQYFCAHRLRTCKRRCAHS